MNENIIILAAGKGSRMKSVKLPKVMCPLAGKPLLFHLLDKLKYVNANKHIVVNDEFITKYGSDIKNLYDDIEFIIQPQANGTADATKTALNNINNNNNISIILNGDCPLISKFIIQKVIFHINVMPHDLLFVGFYTNKPNHYGKFILDENNKLVKIAEKDDPDYSKTIKYCNSGLFAFKNDKVKNLINNLPKDAITGEYQITKLAEIAQEQNLNVGFLLGDEAELQGANTQQELNIIEKLLTNSLNLELA